MRTLTIAAVLVATAVTAGAQTTGVICCNDYTINGFGSGSTSCTTYVNPPNTPMVLNVSAGIASPLVIFGFSLCPCFPGYAVIPSCCAPVNSLDLDLSCPIFTWNVIPVPHPALCNVATLAIGSCPPGISFATQALVIDPACPAGAQFTQAYDVLCL